MRPVGRQDFGLRRELSRTLELRRSAKLSRAVETLPALRISIPDSRLPTPDS
jgi:hypothetical protein